MCAAGAAEEGAAEGGTGAAEAKEEAAAVEGQAVSTVHDAARAGDTHSITRLLAGGADVNGKDRLKRAPMHLAAWAGRVDTIEYLVGCGGTVKIEAADGITRKLLVSYDSTALPAGWLAGCPPPVVHADHRWWGARTQRCTSHA